MAKSTQAQRLLLTLEQLLAVESVSLRPALEQAADLIASAIKADKVDAFFLEPETETLVAVGTSNTPMGARQRQVGLDRLPIANGGPEVMVFLTGRTYSSGRLEEDLSVVPGLINVLGIHSTIIVPLVVSGERRGVLQACAAATMAFTKNDLDFLNATANWVGTIAHRAELVEVIKQDAALQARQVAAEEIVTVLAHDLSNYITPLRGRLDLILQRATRRRDEHYIQDAQAASRALRRLMAIIGDLLDIGRIDQGIFSLSRHSIDLVALVAQVADAMQPRQSAIVVRAPDELIVEVDAARMSQAIENLIANALKHSPADATVEINISRQTRNDGVWASVAISDLGPGLPSDLLPRLFTRFGAGPGSVGLGLGLYLARSIAEAHNGTLTAESAAGTGTIFTLAVPMV